jgi:hypothetical protein
VVFHELERRHDASRLVAEASGFSEAEVGIQIRELNDRLRAQFRYDSDPIETNSAGGWRIDGVAGLLQLNEHVELEVVPKFLDPNSPTWRMDFFVITVFVQTGHLLAHDEITADIADRGALATLIARSLLLMHEENERRPIRAYRRRGRSDFSLDGDVDWESLSLPEPDGFRMSTLELTKRNPYNATLDAALNTLIPEVSDADTQAQLQLRSRGLGAQSRPPQVHPRLPLRFASWNTAYELSQLIADGLGLDLTSGRFTGPGFVLSTWQAWQELCEHIVRRANPGRRVTGQARMTLGYREAGRVEVTPDISVDLGAAGKLLLDAKYKTRLSRTTRIRSGDLYESLAFVRAAKSSYVALLYPSSRPCDELPTGEWRRFDRISVDDITVDGIEVQIQGVSALGGFDRLVLGAKEGQLLTDGAGVARSVPLRVDGESSAS